MWSEPVLAALRFEQVQSFISAKKYFGVKGTLATTLTLLLKTYFINMNETQPRYLSKI